MSSAMRGTLSARVEAGAGRSARRKASLDVVIFKRTHDQAMASALPANCKEALCISKLSGRYIYLEITCAVQRAMPFRPFKLLAVATLLAVASVSVQAADLTVSAAASLTNAFRDTRPRCSRRAHPGTRVRFNFGASGALLQQIAKGAPVDVFASADQETMDQAQAQALVQRRRSAATSSSNALVRDRAGAQRAAAAERSGRPGAAGLRAHRDRPAGQRAGGPLHAAARSKRAGLWAAVEPKMIGAQQRAPGARLRGARPRSTPASSTPPTRR